MTCCKARKNFLKKSWKQGHQLGINRGRGYEKAEHTCSAQAAKGNGSPGHQQYMKCLQREQTRAPASPVGPCQLDRLHVTSPFSEASNISSPLSSTLRQLITRLLLNHRQQAMFPIHLSCHIHGLKQTLTTARGWELPYSPSSQILLLPPSLPSQIFPLTVSSSHS